MAEKTLTIEIPAIVSLSIAGLGTKRDVDLSTAADPAGAAMVLFNYGTQRWLNDKTGGADQTDEERVEKASKRIAALLGGTVRSGGGGGAKLSRYEKALRGVVVDYLLSIGTKGGDALKLAHKPQAAFFDVLEAKLKAKAAKMKADGDEGWEHANDSQALAAAFNVNWPKVESQAQALAKLAKKTPTVDL